MLIAHGNNSGRFSEPDECDDTQGTVNVLNLVEGAEVIVESPDALFPPFFVHYAETFIVPAAVGRFTVRPSPNAVGRYATIKAYVREGPVVARV